MGRPSNATCRPDCCTCCAPTSRATGVVGPNIDLYQQCVRRFPGVAWQASGGVSAAADLHALAATGVAAVISGAPCSKAA